MLITARTDNGALVGFAFGFTMAADSWWGGVEQPDAVKGRAKFALIELVVDPLHRGQGLSRKLMNEVLSGRSEPLATLCAHPEAEPARSMYDRWGWNKVGTVGLADDLADILVLELEHR